MARSYAQILCRIWSDADFRALDPAQQWLYMLLLSQPHLSSAGVLPLQPRRWASLSAGTTSTEVMAALTVLAERRFVVVDEDTEEVLIRSFVRNDGLWQVPNMLIAALRDIECVQSLRLRAALCDELDRLPLDELRGRRSDELRAKVLRVAETLRRTLPITHSGTHTPTLSETLPLTPTGLSPTLSRDGDRTNDPDAVGLTLTPSEGLALPPGVGVGVGEVVTSVGTHLFEAAPDDAAPANPKPKKPARRATAAPDHLLITDDMRRWARERGVTVDLDRETERMLDHHRAKGSLMKDWVAAWRTWMNNSVEFAARSGRSGSTGPRAPEWMQR